MTSPPETLPVLSDGIERQTLQQLRGRFLAVNQGRMGRAMEGLAPGQQSLLRLLALFFHVNHPLLPGYVSACTPAGVTGYEPDAPTLAAAQQLIRGFACSMGSACASEPIHGLFLMGSLGTLAQTDQSDMDVWICLGPDLSDVALAALRKKCRRLEVWAASQGVEAHFFLIDAQRFAQGECVSQPSHGDSAKPRNTLLLDEFYRTAIWLAGRTPMWWWVPAHEEARYAEFAQGLLANDVVGCDETIDLGHLAQIAPGEFLGAGLWQLFKGIESPYKSLLKLLLVEVYASEHPRVNCLSLSFKQTVYANRLDLDELDPYVVVYRRIEQYLQGRGELQRLELVRRSLYLKVGHKLSGSETGMQWQRRLLQRLTREWGWNEQHLAMLDNRSRWEAQQVSHELRALARELSVSYRSLSQLARDEPVPAW
ncbi:class I adenylate cyclase [Pseudomonas psychrophila]|nr:class I adenylate cyclase [Pseudomonas psychrophila]KMM96667.1 adenylate cyclase [Pseudomonas psychrophila]QIE31361.1 class I adenylate cyclase [Pseudomonas psychrophila]